MVEATTNTGAVEVIEAAQISRDYAAYAYEHRGLYREADRARAGLCDSGFYVPLFEQVRLATLATTADRERELTEALVMAIAEMEATRPLLQDSPSLRRRAAALGTTCDFARTTLAKG